MRNSVGKFRNSNENKNKQVRNRSKEKNKQYIRNEYYQQNYKTVAKLVTYPSNQQQTMDMNFLENRNLKKKIVKLQQENKILKTQIQRLRNELSRCKFMHADQYKQLNKNLRQQQKQKTQQNKQNEYLKGISSVLEQSLQNGKKIQQESKQLIKSTDVYEKNESFDMIQLIEKLKQQLDVVEKLKDKYKEKYIFQKQKNNFINQQVNVFIKEKNKYEDKLYKYIQINKKCQVQNVRLEMYLQQALRDMQKLLQGQKKKQQTIELRHKKMHLQIEKLQLKNKKYKQKIVLFKEKKDEFRDQMKKAWKQVGRTTLQKCCSN